MRETEMSVAMVWYAAYGSNVDRRRFITYLTGGPVPGTDDAQAGALDAAPPRRDEAYRFNRSIRFAHHSPRWNGATAVLDHATGSEGALGRRYLITESQFADVVAQENRRPSAELPLSELVVGEVHPITTKSYDGLLLLETDEGIPIVTFTSPTDPTELDPAPPSSAYLGTLARGILDAHRLSGKEIACRLHDAPGVTPTWSMSEIEALVE